VMFIQTVTLPLQLLWFSGPPRRRLVIQWSLSDGFLRSEELYEKHPIQQGMDAMSAVASEDEE
ncbi:hypothetical protein C476_15473, partial [Natrinema limicola JCM 13563]